VAKLVIDRISSNSPLSADLARRALLAEQKATSEMELPAARDRLARLIEREARIMAEDITSEQVEELVERRATEKAQALYDTRMLAETEAVKAELRVDASEVASPPAEELIAEEQRRQERERIARERGGPRAAS
jgi:hypothetical protein